MLRKIKIFMIALLLAVAPWSLPTATALDKEDLTVTTGITEHYEDINPERDFTDSGHGESFPAGIRFGTCTASSDWVHVTRGEASGHAWWSTKGRNCNVAKATITIRLQAYKNGRWVNMTANKKFTLSPGTYKRANARKICNGTNYTTWRTVFEVNYHGVADPIQWNYSAPKNIPCGA